MKGFQQMCDLHSYRRNYSLTDKVITRGALLLKRSDLTIYTVEVSQQYSILYPWFLLIYANTRSRRDSKCKK